MQFKKNLFFQSFLLSLLVFIWQVRDVPNIIINVFTERDYVRAIELFSGKFVWFGPELSHFGYSPGPFLYYLTALPAYFGGYEGLAVFMYLLFAVSCGVIWYYLSKNFDWMIALIISFLYISSNIVFNSLINMMNPSFVFLFWVFMAIFLYQSYITPEKRKYYWYLFCALTGLAAQVHISSLYWLPFAIAALAFKKFSKKNILNGIGILMAVQLPFWIWLPYSNPFHTWPALLLRFDELIIPGPVIPSMGFDMKLIPTIANNFLNCFGAPVLILAILAAYEIAISRGSRRDLLKSYIPIAAALLVVFYFLKDFFAPLVYFRYQLPLLFVLIPSSAYVFYNIRNKLPARKVNHFSAVCIVVMAILTAALNFYFPIQYSSTAKVNLNTSTGFPLYQRKKIAEMIYQKTGWNEHEFSKRVLYVDFPDVIALKYIYKDLIQTLTKPVNVDPNISGFILSYKDVEVEKIDENSAYPVLAGFIKNQSLKILDKAVFEDLNLYSYQIASDTLPISLNNLSDHYLDEWSHFYENSTSYARYSIHPFGEMPAEFDIYYNPRAHTVVLHSNETTRKFVVQPQLYIEDPVFEYDCDDSVKTLPVLSLGFPLKVNHDEFYLTPLEYRIPECQVFKPVAFKAKSIIYTRWMKNDRTMIKKDFNYAF
ncbi:MAG: ArnT family glycosyltransferase [Pseudobdellovibrio sp.]